MLFRFTGQTDEISFQAVLINDGVDVSNGTSGTAVKTLAEQIEWIQDDIYTEDFDVDWTLIQTVFLPSPGVDGVLTKLDINQDAGSPNFATVSVQFKRGKIGNL